MFGRAAWLARSSIGYMPQHVFYDPQFPVTVMDIVLMGRLGRRGLGGFFGWHDRADRQAALESLEQVDMGAFIHWPFASLSGGQRQRALVARALCSRPELLLLDEPTSNVDTLVESHLWELLRKLNRSMTILMVTHDLGVVSNLAEKVICVNRNVVLHTTREVTGELISNLYGGHVRMVRHGEHLEKG